MAIITRWWPWWADATIGIATGAASGLIVLDSDPRHGGDDTLADLEREHGLLPETPRVLTGGGGLHVYLAHPGGHIACSAGALGPGLDVRGDRGYIVAPPSLHASGRRYAWAIGYGPAEIPLAEAPAWLLSLVTAPAAASSGPGCLRRDGTPLMLVAGQRNDLLYRLACALRRYGIGEAALLKCLAAIDHHHAHPPLGDLAELRKIAASAARHAPSEQTGTVRVP